MGSSGQLYSLSWGEFGSSLASAVQLLRGHGDLVDVTLAAGGRSFAAHKIVLSAASSFLLDLLKSTPCEHPVLMLVGISAEDLETILEFVYQGEVSVEPAQLPSLLQAAQCLNIHGLIPNGLGILHDNTEETPSLATTSNESMKESSTSLSGRKRRKRKRSSTSAKSLDNNMDSLNPDYDLKEGEISLVNGIDQREAELNQLCPSPSLSQPIPPNENPHQDSLSDSEPHLHNLMPMQTYSPLHIPQFPASLGIGFSSIPSITQTQAIAAAHAMSTSSGKIRGASDCPGVCPLCGATLRQARNLRRHLVSSCKYRLNSYAGLRSQSPSDATAIEVKPEVDMASFAEPEGFSLEDSNSCEHIVCKPSLLPSPSNVVSPNSNSNLPSSTIT